MIRASLAPSTGCTEPAAIALNAATARKAAQGTVTQVTARLDAYLFKNAMGVGIPGADERGVDLCVALGITAGDADAGMNALHTVTAEQLAAAFAALHEHANKALLDGLTQDDIDNWNGANVLTKDNTTPYEPRGEYQPATVRFVLDRVVAIGAADMQARIYDPQNRQADIFGEMDKTAAALRKEMAEAWENARYIIDDVTGEKYRLGVSGGGLYYRKEEKA